MKPPRKKQSSPPRELTQDELRAQLSALLNREGGVQALADVLKQPSPAVTKEPESRPEKMTLREHVQHLLLEKVMDGPSLAKATRVRERQELYSLLKELEKEGLVYNLRGPDNPFWTWRVGPNVEPRVLHAQIVKLLKKIPMERGDIIRATGATGNQVDGQLTEIRRSSAYDIQNLADEDIRDGMYFIFGSSRDAHLAPKKTPKGVVITHGNRRGDKGQ